MAEVMFRVNERSESIQNSGDKREDTENKSS